MAYYNDVNEYRDRDAFHKKCAFMLERPEDDRRFLEEIPPIEEVGEVDVSQKIGEEVAESEAVEEVAIMDAIEPEEVAEIVDVVPDEQLPSEDVSDLGNVFEETNDLENIEDVIIDEDKGED